MTNLTQNYNTYIEILKKELVASMGCTEPIAIAYGAAVAKEVLGSAPNNIHVSISNNVIKNAKSVVVPNTGGLKGIKAATLAGIIAGNPHNQLEVIANVSKEEVEAIHKAFNDYEITIKSLISPYLLDIVIELSNGTDQVKVRINETHANIAQVVKNGESIKEWINEKEEAKAVDIDYTSLNIKEIIEFADSFNIDDLKKILDKQIEYNYNIAIEGLKNDYGANIGKTILKNGDNSIKTKAIAMASAGSDARMSGCELPVIINSGSGNQGITVAVPVIVYAKELKVSDEELYRALTLANLISIHAKNGIGTLSAYCGAVTAGCASGCGIAYLHGGRYEAIAHTLVNSIAIVSGIICDGAKPSCAGKIASSLDAGILGYQMYLNGQEFKRGDGIVDVDVEKTIKNIHHLGKEGMKETDVEIVKIMTK